MTWVTTMVFIKQYAFSLASMISSISVLGATLEVGGIKINGVQNVQASKVPSNGAGVPYKAVF